MKLKIVGIDGSMSNFGAAQCLYDTDTGEIEVVDLKLTKTEPEAGKTVVKTADNYRRAQEVAAGMREATAGQALAIAEIPLLITPHPGMNPAAASVANHGSGVTIGVLANCSIPLIPVMPADVKLAAVGSRNADKKEMIDWAMTRYPNAPWRTRNLRGQKVPTADNEHLADAVAIVHAGVKTAQFKGMLSMLRATQ